MLTLGWRSAGHGYGPYSWRYSSFYLSRLSVPYLNASHTPLWKSGSVLRGFGYYWYRQTASRTKVCGGRRQSLHRYLLLFWYWCGYGYSLFY